MHRRILRAAGFVVALATAACAPPVTWREPVSLDEHPKASMVETNMVMARLTRMALPEGWAFKPLTRQDSKDVLLRIVDRGSNAVAGVVRFLRLGSGLSLRQVALSYAENVMKDYEEKEIRKTEIDGREAYLIQGTKMKGSRQLLTALLVVGPDTILQIALATDPDYLRQSRPTAYAIVNSYKLVPPGVSARRLRGTFSFKSEYGAFSWYGDVAGPWASRGFAVRGKAGDDNVFLAVQQVTTTQLAAFVDKEIVIAPEFATELHLAGRTYPARALGIRDREGKGVGLALVFAQDGKDYLLKIYRETTGHRDVDVTNLHNDASIRHALDTYFYFDG